MAPAKGCDVWPENWQAKNVAVRMNSQLNVGMSGVIGMRYEALPVVLDLLGIPAADRLYVFDGLRVIEAEMVRLLND